MIQFTDREGRVWPIAFDWTEPDSVVQRVNIDKFTGCKLCAERNSGTVGDRYECEINGQVEYLYYTVLQPRKWFEVEQVSREEHNAYNKFRHGVLTHTWRSTCYLETYHFLLN